MLLSLIVLCERLPLPKSVLVVVKLKVWAPSGETEFPPFVE
jgi:hypothetical protein